MAWTNTALKSVRIRSYSGWRFPAFELNTDQNNSEYEHFSCNVIFWPKTYFQYFVMACMLIEWFKIKKFEYIKNEVWLLLLLVKHKALQFFRYLFSFLVETFPEYCGILSKKHFTDHRTANKIRLLAAIKGNFSGLFFFKTISIKININSWTKPCLKWPDNVAATGLFWNVLFWTVLCLLKMQALRAVLLNRRSFNIR